MMVPSGSAQPQKPQDAKRAATLRLIEAMGMRKMMDSIMPQMFQQIRQQTQAMMPKDMNSERAMAMSDLVMTISLEEMKKFDIEGLTIEVYQKHFALEEIEALAQFYESPVGRKFLEKTPLIVQDTMAASAQWSKGLNDKIMKALKDKFPELQTEVPPSQK